MTAMNIHHSDTGCISPQANKLELHRMHFEVQQ